MVQPKLESICSRACLSPLLVIIDRFSGKVVYLADGLSATAHVLDEPFLTGALHVSLHGCSRFSEWPAFVRHNGHEQAAQAR